MGFFSLISNMLIGYESGVIRASEFRTYHTPLNKQVWKHPYTKIAFVLYCKDDVEFFTFVGLLFFFRVTMSVQYEQQGSSAQKFLIL